MGIKIRFAKYLFTFCYLFSLSGTIQLEEMVEIVSNLYELEGMEKVELNFLKHY